MCFLYTNIDVKYQESLFGLKKLTASYDVGPVFICMPMFKRSRPCLVWTKFGSCEHTQKNTAASWHDKDFKQSIKTTVLSDKEKAAFPLSNLLRACMQAAHARQNNKGLWAVSINLLIITLNCSSNFLWPGGKVDWLQLVSTLQH